ncbi:MAG: SDR family NAD(P)-dependent oxidoreductase [Proteobacteria bacterium]|nr:SDR family NAD(P)-dependent oxidoreductase [Pseudomonadota bacterium]
MVGYGTTKCALQYLTDGLAPEHRDTNVLVGSISPGLVRTETVARGIPHIPPAMRASRFEFMNAIAELPTTSAAWIVAQTSSNRRNGVRLVWLTRRRLLLRLLQRKLRPRRVLQDRAAAGGPDCSDSAT